MARTTSLANEDGEGIDARLQCAHSASVCHGSVSIGNSDTLGVSFGPGPAREARRTRAHRIHISAFARSRTSRTTLSIPGRSRTLAAVRPTPFRYLGSRTACFREADSDGLLPTRDLFARTTRAQTAVLSLVQRLADFLARGLSVGCVRSCVPFSWQPCTKPVEQGAFPCKQAGGSQLGAAR